MAQTDSSIVVTGLGAVSCLGRGVGALWDGVLEGRCGIRPLSRLNSARHRCRLCGEAPLSGDVATSLDPAIAFLVEASEEALNAAGLDGPARGEAVLVAASNFAAMNAMDRFLADPRSCPEEIVEYLFAEGPLRAAERRLGLRSGGVAVSLSCASGNAAIGCAADLLRAGRAEAALAVGYDAVSESAWAGLCALRAMSAEAVRPFDRRRDGTIFGEGAGALVLETRSHAARRGARPLAEYLGWGSSNNAYHLTHPDAGGEGMIRAMRSALDDAGLSPDAVDHINAHATGTPLNDRLETLAIKSVFGAHSRDIPISGVKGMIAHAMGAAGALEALITILTLRHGVLPATVGLEDPDPECDLDYVPLKPRAATPRIALNNSAGFGGCNAATLFRRWEDTP